MIRSISENLISVQTAILVKVTFKFHQMLDIFEDSPEPECQN